MRFVAFVFVAALGSLSMASEYNHLRDLGLSIFSCAHSKVKLHPQTGQMDGAGEGSTTRTVFAVKEADAIQIYSNSLENLRATSKYGQPELILVEKDGVSKVTSIRCLEE